MWLEELLQVLIRSRASAQTSARCEEVVRNAAVKIKIWIWSKGSVIVAGREEQPGPSDWLWDETAGRFSWEEFRSSASCLMFCVRLCCSVRSHTNTVIMYRTVHILMAVSGHIFSSILDVLEILFLMMLKQTIKLSSCQVLPPSSHLGDAKWCSSVSG